jgi:hypothetical protein
LDKAYEKAASACEHRTELEPDLKDNYSTLLDIYAELKAPKKLMVAQDQYKAHFGVSFTLAALSSMEGYAWMAKDPIMKKWAKAQR